MNIEVILGISFPIISTILGILGYQLNKTNQRMKKQQLEIERQQKEKNEVRKDSIQEAKLETQLDYISKGVDDIRIDLRANEKERIALGERVTRVEESAKQAHKRIDKIEGDSND